jgi:hypothetical protein
MSADAMREAWTARRSSPLAPFMSFTDQGLVLGAGTMLAKRRPDHGLALDGEEERLLALLAVGYGRPVSPKVIGNLQRAARDWANGERCLALVHLARTGLPQLAAGEAAPFRLFAAERLIEEGVCPRRLLELLDLDTSGLDLLKEGFDPDEPRIPAGNPDRGQWTDEDGVTPAAARRRPAQNPFPADKDPFFDTLYDPVHAAADRLGIDETWLLGLAAHESGWLNPHNREINDPFGVTHAGGRNVQYDSIGDAVAAWERRYGPVARGATSAEDFVQRLSTVPYNVKPEWPGLVLEGIRSVQRRLDSWKSRHGL